MTPSGKWAPFPLLSFVHSIFASIQDASVDAMAIGITPENERGRVNAFMRGGMLTGVGLGAALFAYLIRAYGFFPAALAQSLLLLLFTVITFFLRERPGDALLPGRRTLRAARTQADAAPDLRWLFGELFRGLTTRQSLRLFGASTLVYLGISLFSRACRSTSSGNCTGPTPRYPSCAARTGRWSRWASFSRVACWPTGSAPGGCCST
jgi:PAT family beta-lactamase induction signal transducer AmpG